MKLIIIIALLLPSCVKRPTIADNQGAGSGLSSVTIAVPSKANYRKFFGPDCKDVDLSNGAIQRAGGDKCAAIELLLAEYRIGVKENRCDPGVKPTEFVKTNSIKDTVIDFKVQKGCLYDVEVELGQIKESKVYYSNQSDATANLDVPKTAGATVNIAIKLMPTSEGVAAGFPNNGGITAEPEGASVDIDVAIGGPNRGSTTATSNSNSTQTNVGSVQTIAFSVVDKIMQKKCSPCHTSEGGQIPFVGSQKRVSEVAKAIQTELEDELMPPEDSGKVLLPAERKLILDYLSQ